MHLKGDVLPISCKAVAPRVCYCVSRDLLSRLADLDPRGCLVAWDICGVDSNSCCWIEVIGWQHWSVNFLLDCSFEQEELGWVRTTTSVHVAAIQGKRHLQNLSPSTVSHQFQSWTSLMRQCTRLWRADLVTFSCAGQNDTRRGGNRQKEKHASTDAALN